MYNPQSVLLLVVFLVCHCSFSSILTSSSSLLSLYYPPHHDQSRPRQDHSRGFMFPCVMWRHILFWTMSTWWCNSFPYAAINVIDDCKSSQHCLSKWLWGLFILKRPAAASWSPSAIVPPHPSSHQKGFYCIPLVPRIDSSVFFPGKCTPSHPPCKRGWAIWRHPTQLPGRSQSQIGFNEASLIPIVWVCVPLGLKLHTQEGRVWFMFAWCSCKARVHMAHNHAQHRTQQKHLQSLPLVADSAFKTYFLMKIDLHFVSSACFSCSMSNFLK